MIDVMMPPPQYDVPYKGPLIEHVLPMDKIEPACTAMGWKRPSIYVVIYGCALMRGGICTIVIPKVNGWWINDQDQADCRRHELAHCNGWPPDHSS